MTDIELSINNIKKKQNTIDALLEIGSLSAQEKDKNKKWIIQSLLQNTECSVGIVTIEKKLLGPCDVHIHYESKEYLICVSGGFTLNINGNSVRTVMKGECGVVEPGQLHYSTPIFDDTKIVYICVPADSNMRLLAEGFFDNE